MVFTHEQATVRFVLSGTMVEQRKCQTDYGLPLSVIIKGPRVPHSNHFGPNGCKTL
jgi:hypothetical protein